jgi:hypothetical protein
MQHLKIRGRSKAVYKKESSTCDEMLLSGENTIDREELVKQLLMDRPDFRFSRCQN